MARINTGYPEGQEPRVWGHGDDSLKRPDPNRGPTAREAQSLVAKWDLDCEVPSYVVSEFAEFVKNEFGITVNIS